MNSSAIEKVLIQGDLSALCESDRIAYYSRVCEGLGLNPLTRPFDYIRLNGKLTLYAKREATEQLRKIHGVSLRITGRELVADSIYVVTAQAALPNGRCDESIGAVSVAGLQNEALANAVMKAETKAKRRVTLSICGLALLDETEVETIPVEALRQPTGLPSATDEIWRTWKTPEDAIAWAASQLPDLPLEVIRSEFHNLPAINGKKAPAWVERVKTLQES